MSKITYQFNVESPPLLPPSYSTRPIGGSAVILSLKICKNCASKLIISFNHKIPEFEELKPILKQLLKTNVALAELEKHPEAKAFDIYNKNNGVNGVRVV
jgi:hypothetical protein